MTRFLLRWTDLAIVHPRRAIAAVVLVTLAALPGLARLSVATDGRALAPPGDPAVRLDAEVRRHFGLRDPVLVVLETPRPDGAYDAGVLRRLQELTAALAGLPGIGPENVVSLATERSDRVYPGTLRFRPLLDPPPDTPARLADLRETVAAIPALSGTLISRDGRAVAVLVGVPDERQAAGGGRAALCRRIAAVAAPFAVAGERVLVVGAPVAETLLGDAVRGDLALLLPLSVALIAAVLWIGCRRFWALAIGLGEVGCCLVCTFGLMGWLGVPVYLTTYLLPLIVTLVGVADEIHLLWRYQAILGRTPAAPAGAPPAAAVRATVAEMMRPVVLSSLAALVAFLSFVSSAIPPVRAFGLFAACGMLVCVVYALTVVPAALALLPADALRAPARLRRSPALALAAALIRRRRTTLAALALATVAMAAGLARLYVQDSWIDGFAPASPLRQATTRADALMDGTHVLLVQVAFGGPGPEVEGRRGPLLAAQPWRALGDLEGFLGRQRGVGGVLGPYDQLTTVSYLAQAREAGTRTIPPQPARIDRLLRRFDDVRGERRRREVVDDDLRRALLTVFLKDANYRDTARLTAALAAYERRHLVPIGARITLAGDVAVSQAMIPAVVASQIASLALALAGALAAVWLFYRSLAVAFLATLPPALAALWILGTMGWAGIPLGVATSMFSALTLGIGVDYGVHFMDRFRAAPPGVVAALHALRVVGPEVTADAAAIALGFGLLALSQVPAVGRLGLLVCVALAASWLLTLVGLAAFLAVSPRHADTSI